MSLLELEHVSKCYGRGLSEQVVLRDASFKVEAGEMVAIWGRRRSGRSTLLRVAAGVESPDDGVVRLEGQDLSGRGCHLLGSAIGYCRKTFRPNEGPTVLDHLLVGQLARGVAPSLATNRAWEALERADAGSCAKLKPSELDCGEILRVGIARALALQPKLLLVDEPTQGVDLLARDTILRLLRSLADDGMAVLMSTGETASLSGARALSISDGEVQGMPTRELAPVLPLRRRSA
ncbi:MAG TPA: ATP-binding cassette domain-containing protein [Solirubrobacteraceae bacterium]|nr:ATP-binding cassette domain-containing protein [Solirubrobacteraceae bacterium]